MIYPVDMEKKIIYVFIAFFGVLGAYLPVIFGASGLSGWSLIGGIVGSFIGLIIGVKVNNNAN